ncbi:probable serine/threonine-protein kinase DDB_G0282963 [Sitodiplosis mosellana]|uniref:probable serine/threonine-protein kinase DDB_G0282963 n=1 Tax=Sitodiplosis mosellana TaxID=263140 RepID=UPI002443EB4C|nr:probable serine/threonine-protein kinase DDB_G0282963 [Sitodiplosis mosellana]
MSWPSIWQTPNQTQGMAQQGAGSGSSSMNLGGMYQLSAEQQYALQQQNWQQWQLYQTQLAQWQAQYGERYQEIMTAQNAVPNMIPNAFNAYQLHSVAPPPPTQPQPPPPPPPLQQTHGDAPVSQNTQTISQVAPNMTQQTPTSSTDQITSEQQPLFNANNTKTSINSNETQVHHSQSANFENTNYSQQNQDGYRRHQPYRNNRWNNNNRNTRTFVGNNFNNRTQPDREDQMNNDGPQQDEYVNEEKSQEEVAFDIQFRKWEDSFMEWKLNNANHPDQNQYNDFVVKMEGCRKQLLVRRETLRQKRLNSFREARIQPANQVRETDESQNEAFEQTTDQESHIPSTQTADNCVQTPGSVLFPSNNDDGGGDIPGLDLVSGEKVPKADLNIVAHVNNILGNPEIQTLLSNIQKQQNETQPSKAHHDYSNLEENDRSSLNTLDQPCGSSDNRFGRYQNNTDTQKHQIINSFHDNNRQSERDVDMDMSQPNSNQFEINSKRRRYWNENSSNHSRNDHIDRDRTHLAQKSPVSDADFYQIKHNCKRPRESDIFFSLPPQNDGEEFHPIQVIDYQNQTQKQPNFGDQTSPGENSSSNKQHDDFPRKIIEYDHKSKVHTWNWFCPVIQIEYNHHSNTGFSLHQHPPPRSTGKKEQIEQHHWVKKEPKDQYRQLRQPKWTQQGTTERLERFSYEPPQSQHQYQHFQSRYDSHIIPSSNTQTSNELYYRRNLREDKIWVRASRDQNAQCDNSPGPKKNAPQKVDSTPSNSSTTYRNDSALNIQTNPKLNIKDLLFPPERRNRPKRIVIIMRGLPGSGKSYLSKVIKDKEQEMGGSARILSIDDYFMTETDSDRQLSYEYEADMERTYTQYLLKSFKKTLLDNLYEVVIVDCKNTTIEDLDDFYMTAKSHMFTPYICEMPLDLEKCLKNNIHNRLEIDIRKAMEEWEMSPASYTVLDYDNLFNSADDTESLSDVEDVKNENADSLDAISDEDNNSNVAMEDVESDDFSDMGLDDEPINEFGVFKSKWDNDTTENKLARLDGTNKPMKHTTIEDYLQMDGWEPPPTSTNGKKRVRWADLEEKREQDKQRAIGFVVGQGWSNLIDQPRDHSHALTKVKYIEKVRKN